MIKAKLTLLAGMTLLAACTQTPTGPIAFVGGQAAAQKSTLSALTADKVGSDLEPVSGTEKAPQSFTDEQLRAFGLSPRVRQAVSTARAKMNSSDFEARMQRGENSFATLDIGDFGIKCYCPLDSKMYAIGGNGLDTTNGLNRIYEYNPTTHAVTQIGTTNSSDTVTSAAIAKHPMTGEIYFIESYAGTRRLFKFNTTTSTRSLIGATGFTGNVVQLAFSRSGILYTMDENGQLFTLNQSTGTPTQIPLTGSLGSTGGDIAFYTDDDTLYRVDRNRVLYRISLTTGVSTSLGTIAGIPTAHIPAGLGFNPAGELLVLTYNSTDSSNRMYRVSLSDLSSTQLQSYTGGTYPMADLTSAHLYTCPDSSSGKPTAPTMLINDNFQAMSANFGNLPGETNPDTTSGWRQWNADYYPAGKGVVVFNPGRYNPATGGIDDPKNDVLGKRSTPGEYNTERPNLLETSIAKTIPLKYTSGDRVMAKLNVAPTFTHGDSDATLMLCFDDPGNTVAVSSTLRGTKTGSSELYIDTVIPACATKVTIIAMGYLGQNEDSSVTFEKASLEYLPQNYYTKTALLTEPFDTATTHSSYGADFPANFDDQFGIYDLYLVNNFPVQTGDKALTASVPTTLDGSFGGLVKRVNLGTVTSKDTLTAKLYTATRFTSAASEASLLMEFYNASNVKLSTVNAQPVRRDQYRWIQIDRAAIPTGATYVKMVPIFKLGTGETASFLWNDLSLEKVTTP